MCLSYTAVRYGSVVGTEVPVEVLGEVVHELEEKFHVRQESCMRSHYSHKAYRQERKPDRPACRHANVRAGKNGQNVGYKCAYTHSMEVHVVHKCAYARDRVKMGGENGHGHYTIASISFSIQKAVSAE